jgi:DNA-binding MarR family transcriptional regulator
MSREADIQELVESFIKLRQTMRSGLWHNADISPAQMGFLLVLFHHKNSTVNEIASFLGISKSAVTQLTDPLVDNGLVSRGKDLKDRRIVRLNLSPRGLKTLKQHKKQFEDRLVTALDGLNNKELDQLVKLHKKIKIRTT